MPTYMTAGATYTPVPITGNGAPKPSPYDQWLANWDPSQIPAYQSAADSSGNVLPQYQVNAEPNVNFSGDINSQPWMKMLQDQNSLSTQQNLDALGASSNSNTATAMSNMATHGGLSQGAMTNLQSMAARNLAQNEQGARATGAWNALNLSNQGVQEQANLDLQNRQYKTGVNEQNVATALSNLQGQNQYNLGKYNTQAGAWGANQTANAMEHSGKKG